MAEIASLAAVVGGWLVHRRISTRRSRSRRRSRVGVGLGAFNGFGVTVLRVPSLIVTLGTAAIAKGLAFMITQGVAFVGRWPVGFTGLARGTTFGIPNLVLWLAGATALRLGAGEMDPHRRPYDRDRRGRRGGAARRHRDRRG